MDRPMIINWWAILRFIFSPRYRGWLAYRSTGERRRRNYWDGER